MTKELKGVYAVKHKSESVRSNSRSGGIFTALSDKVLEDNGVVYGCILVNNINAVHFRAENKEQRNKMRGSKYIQSDLGDIFKSVKKDLDNDVYVLFSGTSCQIAGLKNYLNKNYVNLICVDIVCHGVPSPLIWEKYVKWQEEKNKSLVTEIDFRNKVKFGWRAHVETLKMENGKTVNSDVFTMLFYKHNILRPSCYKCPFKKIHHPGDITIADYWGIENVAPEFDDNKGVSLVLVNTDKGLSLFDEVKNHILWKETKIENSMQDPLRFPFPKPSTRDEFWNDFQSKDFDSFLYKYCDIGLSGILKKIKRKIRKLVN